MSRWTSCPTECVGTKEIGPIHVYDDQPDYDGKSVPEGCARVRHLTQAACFLMQGYRIREVHKVERCEADYQIVFDMNYREKVNVLHKGDTFYNIVGAYLHELCVLLGKAYPVSRGFRFIDITVRAREAKEKPEGKSDNRSILI